MNWGLILVITGFVSSVFCKMDSDTKCATIAKNIRKDARIKIEESKVDILEMRDLRNTFYNTKTEFDRLKRLESEEINNLVHTDISAKEAINKLNGLEKQYKMAKKAVDNFKPDEVSVAVGSGDNAAAVSIKNSGAKAVLDQNLADISAKRSLVQKELADIKNNIANSVRNNRTAEYYDAKSSYDVASKKYNDAVAAENAEINNLLQDRDWTHKQFVKHFKETHTETDIILKGIVYSIIPVVALVYIWKNVILGLRTLKEVIA